jgi:hypothetical protein
MPAMLAGELQRDEFGAVDDAMRVRGGGSAGGALGANAAKRAHAVALAQQPLGVDRIGRLALRIAPRDVALSGDDGLLALGFREPGQRSRQRRWRRIGCCHATSNRFQLARWGQSFRFPILIGCVIAPRRGATGGIFLRFKKRFLLPHQCGSVDRRLRQRGLGSATAACGSVDFRIFLSRKLHASRRYRNLRPSNLPAMISQPRGRNGSICSIGASK